MDTVLIKTNKRHKYEQVCALSSRMIMHTDSFVKLADSVYEFLSTPHNDKIPSLMESLAVCTESYPDFDMTRQLLVSLLIDNGNLLVEDPNNTTSVDADNTNEPDPAHVTTEETNNSNIVNVDFTKNRVDLHK